MTALIYAPGCRVAERTGGPRANTKSGAPQNGLREGGSAGRPPGKFEILHVLKCVLGAPEARFRACTQYVCYTCKLTYGALASGLRSVMIL